MSISVKKGIVWLYFSNTSLPDKAKCNLCKSVLSYKGTTTNLRKHLEARHPTIDLPNKKICNRNADNHDLVNVDTEEDNAIAQGK